MSKNYDVIVIGGGHNGLTAAATLGKRGKKVLLVEQRAILGGIAAGEEFYPGYKTAGLLHDTSNIRRKVVNELELENFGLHLENQRNTITILAEDKKYIHLSSNLENCHKEIERYSKKDADAYLEYRAFIDKISKFIVPLMSEFPPDLVNLGNKQILALAKKGIALKRLGKKTMMEFLKVAPMSVVDFLDEKFETEFLKAGLAGPTIYGSFTGPRASYSTLNLLLWECLSNYHIKGGPQKLIDALVKCAASHGVEIMTDAVVEQILLDDKRNVSGILLKEGKEIKTKTIAASCTPKETFLNLIKPNHLEYKLEQGFSNFRSRGTTAKIHLAIKGAIKFVASPNSAIEYARTGHNFIEMEKASDAIKYGAFSERPVLDIYIPTLSDSSLAPEGHNVLSVLVHYAPYQLKNGWDHNQVQLLKEKVLSVLRSYIEDIDQLIEGIEVLSPKDLESRYKLTEGHIFHGEHAVDQIASRPIPYCALYDTPIKGLFLCGSGSHPGGGITCAPGKLGADRILKLI
jgi:phytoene dehydrogenase-like protein